MRPETQLRIATVVSMLCFAVIIVCLGQLLGQGSALSAGPGTTGDGDRDPALPKVELLKAELRNLRREHDALKNEKQRLSTDVSQQEKTIAAQKEELQNMAEQLRRRPAQP